MDAPRRRGRPARAPGELQPAEEKFCQLVAAGYDQTAAARKAYAARRLSDQAYSERGSKLAARPDVQARIFRIVAELEISTIDSAPHVLRDVLDAYREARADRQWTAIAALARVRAQIQGLLRDTVVLRAEGSLTDEQLAKQISDGDPDLAHKVHLLLGRTKKVA